MLSLALAASVCVCVLQVVSSELSFFMFVLSQCSESIGIKVFWLKNRWWQPDIFL